METLSKLKSSFTAALTKASSVPFLSKAIIGFGSKLYPPPYRRNNMEFKYGAWMGTSTVIGTDGRPLGEDNATPAFYREPIPTEYLIGKFGDSRDGKCFNMTALRDVMKDWNKVMALINTFRAYYIETFNISSDKFSAMDLFIFSKLLVGTTSFLVRSKKHVYHSGNLPRALTSQTKLVAGVFMIGRKMIERGEDFFNDSEPADANFMYEYADKQHILISPRDANYACAGSIKKIKELIQVTISGWDSENSEIQDEELAKTLANCYPQAFQYTLLDLQMELIIQFAQASILEVLLAHMKGDNNPQKNEILNFARNQFPEEYFDVDTLGKHKKHLRTILGKLGSMQPITPQKESSTFKNFPVMYLKYLKKMRSFCEQQQNEINHLLGIKPLDDLSTKEINKRLQIVPQEVFNSF